MNGRLKALQLLDECTGDDIWSVDHCLTRGIPQLWIDELSDCFESGFHSDRQTIYVEQEVTNQYHGVRDVDLARRLAAELGVDVQSLEACALSRSQLVTLIKQAYEEM